MIGERKFYTAMDRYTRSVRPTPLESARSMALSAMAVECERFIYLFILVLNEIAPQGCSKQILTIVRPGGGHGQKEVNLN